MESTFFLQGKDGRFVAICSTSECTDVYRKGFEFKIEGVGWVEVLKVCEEADRGRTIMMAPLVIH